MFRNVNRVQHFLFIQRTFSMLSEFDMHSERMRYIESNRLFLVKQCPNWCNQVGMIAEFFVQTIVIIRLQKYVE